MTTFTVEKKKPRDKKKKIIIITAVIAMVCLSASGGLYIMFKSRQHHDESGRWQRQWRDANIPNPHEQSAEEIIQYRNSAAYKNLSPNQQVMYTMASGRKLLDYHINNYFTIPKEQQTAYLDKLIDEMQALRPAMEQMRNQWQRERRPRDANDPNRQARQAERAAQRANPANARARSERGTALQRAQRMKFFSDLQKRMKERGINMPPPMGRGRF